MSKVDLIFGVLAVALQGGVAAILLRKKLHRRFPLFMAYTFYSLAITAERFILLWGSDEVIFVNFLVTESLYALLGLLAIYESFREIFLPFYRVRWFFPLLWLVIAATLAASISRAVFHPPVQAYRLGAIVLSLEIGVRYVQGGIFLLCWALWRFFKIRPRRYPLAIVDGFGVAAVGILAASMLRSEFGIRFNTLFQFAPAVAYIVALVVWLFYLQGPDKINGESEEPLPLDQLKEIRDELRRSGDTARKIGRKDWKRLPLGSA